MAHVPNQPPAAPAAGAPSILTSQPMPLGVTDSAPAMATAGRRHGTRRMAMPPGKPGCLIRSHLMSFNGCLESIFSRILAATEFLSKKLLGVRVEVLRLDDPA